MPEYLLLFRKPPTDQQRLCRRAGGEGCGRAAELSASYFADGVWHLEQQDAEHATPSLFDALETAAPPPDKPAVEFYRDGSLGPTPEPKRKEPIWP
jgi:hypothetical protein